MELPDEIILNIFKYVSLFDVKSLSYVSKRFNKIIKEIKHNIIYDIWESNLSYNQLTSSLTKFNLNMYVCYINYKYSHIWNIKNHLTEPYGPVPEKSRKYKSITYHNSFYHLLSRFIYNQTKTNIIPFEKLDENFKSLTIDYILNIQYEKNIILSEKEIKEIWRDEFIFELVHTTHIETLKNLPEIEDDIICDENNIILSFKIDK